MKMVPSLLISVYTNTKMSSESNNYLIRYLWAMPNITLMWEISYYLKFYDLSFPLELSVRFLISQTDYCSIDIFSSSQCTTNKISSTNIKRMLKGLKVSSKTRQILSAIIVILVRDYYLQPEVARRSSKRFSLQFPVPREMVFPEGKVSNFFFFPRVR